MLKKLRYSLQIKNMTALGEIGISNKDFSFVRLFVDRPVGADSNTIESSTLAGNIIRRRYKNEIKN